ncbi:MAG TPA: methyltransferase domain-containing protein [Thermoanaerobaculia bacterium]|nr:methyltransferase domain-containing protein [Thermoanaerobaculia bacterium]
MNASAHDDPRRHAEHWGRRREQRLAWERIAATVTDFHDAPTTQQYRRCEIALIERTLGPLAGRRVLKLDLWNEAHNTRILHWMTEQGAEAFGFDVSGLVTRRARRNANGNGLAHRMLCADIREIPFADASFDYVYTMGTIEHIPEYRTTLREIHRVLRPGGRAVIGVPHKWNLFLRPLMVELLSRCGLYLYAPEKSFGAGELRRDIEGAGLEVVGRSGILTLPGLLRMADLYLYTRRIPLYRLSGWASAPFALLETRWSWPGRFGYLMAMTAVRPTASG